MAIGALSRDPARLRNSSGPNSPRSPQDRIDAAPSHLQGPVRMCRACRKRLSKTQLTRWVRREGQVALDVTQNLPGRGYYTCSDACAERLPKTIKPIKHRR